MRPHFRAKTISAAAAALSAVGASGCSDFVFHEHPGAAAIVVTFRQPQQHPGDFCKKYENASGVDQADCGLNGASFAFDKNASGSKVGTLSLQLNRDPRVSTVLVSVVGSTGDEVVRP